MTSYKKIEIRGKDLILSRYTGLDPADEFSVTFKTLDESSNYVIHRDILRHQLSQKQGTVSTKTRSEVRGGGKKPWRQKGTGRARAGTSRSPLWRGGGVVFPASTKSAKPKKLNKKMYKSAMRSIFSSLAKENRVFLSDKINIENPKTKAFVDFLNKNELKEGLFIVDEISNNLDLASRNLPNVNVTNLNTLNPINLLKFNSIVISENCLNLIEEKLS